LPNWIELPTYLRMIRRILFLSRIFRFQSLGFFVWEGQTAGTKWQPFWVHSHDIVSGIEPQSDSFDIICSDGLNRDEAGATFDITILPTNDEQPEIYVNDFVVEEGRLLQIDLPILNVIDKDEPPEVLMFTVSDGRCLIYSLLIV